MGKEQNDTPSANPPVSEYMCIWGEAGLLANLRALLKHTLWHSQERLDLFNAIGPAFTYLLSYSLETSLVVRAARLLDPMRTDKPVLSMFQFLSQPMYRDIQDAGVLRKQATKHREDYSNIINMRHKLIAHLDTQEALRRGDDSGLKYTWGQLDDLVSEILSIVDRMSRLVFENTTPSSYCQVEGEIERLIDVLTRGTRQPSAPSANPPRTPHPC